MSTNLLPPLFHHAPVAIAALDLGGRVADANPALLTASGYSIDELRGRPFSDFLDPDGERDARADLARLVAGLAESYRAERRYRSRNGELRDIELAVSLLRNEAGAPDMCLAVLQDVTEHKRALAALAHRAAQLEAVIESIPAGVYIGESTGINLANRAGLDLLGFDSLDQLKYPVGDLSEQLENRDAATGQRIEAKDEPFSRALRGEEVDAEVRSRHIRTGEPVIQRVIAAPVRVAGQIVGAVAVNTNITERRRTEELLRLSEARYRALVEQSPLSIQILSPDGRTLKVNSAWQRMWGLTLEQMDGYNLLEDRQLEDRGLLPYIREAFGGRPAEIPAALYDTERTLPHASSLADTRIWVRGVIYPIKDDQGQVREVVLIHDDMTERVRSDEERRAATELLQLVVQQSAEAIVVSDAAGILRIFNPAAERLHGVAGAPTPSEQWSERYRLLRQDGTPLPLEETPLYRALQGEATRDGRWLVARDDGSTRMLVGTSVPLRTAEGSPAGAVLIARDETERVAAEAERERLLVEARDAHREVESASRLKDEFLATLSHELRTPLNAVLGWVRILQARTTEPANLHALGVIERNAAVQARLIDDLLDVSRIIAGKIGLRREHVDLSAVAHAALESIRPAAEAAKLTIHTAIAEDLPGLSGDAQRLQQVFWNLLSNAVKFSEPGGHITLTAARVGADFISVTVADTGIGISPDMLPSVFDRFSQADTSSTRTHAGLGLGLAIVRHLVELHGGSVTAESAGLGQGATFRVALPMRSSGPSQPARS